jgi:CHASE2 domain-containing sensor protein
MDSGNRLPSRWLLYRPRAGGGTEKRKPESIIMAGLSTQVYANLGGLLAGLVAFVLVALSYFMFSQPFKLGMTTVVPLVLINLFLAVYLIIMIYYNSEFQTKVQV